MSWRATAWAVQQRTGHPTLKVLLLVLADRADENGLAWPGVARMADECEVSEDTVSRGLKKLSDMGFLKVMPRYRENGSQTTNAYRLCFDRPEGGGPQIAGGEGRTHAGEGAAPMHPLEPSSSNLPEEPIPASSASPQKQASAAKKPCPSADQQPPQEGSAEWLKIEVWNVVGNRFKERFYPTVSMAVFKKRLGHEIKRLDNDLRKVRLAMLETLRAEPGLDAWEYFCGVARQQPKDSEPRMRGTI